MNKLCELEDFQQPAIIESIRQLEADHVIHIPDYPAGREHRKSWEYAQLMCGAEQLGVLGPDAFVLAVAAGHERPVFALTQKARLVFATDIYGSGDFSSGEAAGNVLINPDKFATIPYNRNRLVVQYMDACDIRHEAGTFDLVFSLSSIEHFGAVTGAYLALCEMARVCKSGGIVMITTECIVNDLRRPEIGGLHLFSEQELVDLVHSIKDLEPVEPVSFELSAATKSHVQNLEQVVADVHLRQHVDYPHIVLEIGNCFFTSVSIFLRKR
ncbi:MAG: methyltransferase domain-containing protein [Bryobacteraceae bacterium]|nr:methyltransferase domain-containing protein [Bryobacteraceae bacterium]